MLTQEQIRKIKKIHIRSRRLVNAMMAGRYKSVFRGSGMEFEEVREYSPGDEIRDIDWKVSARLGRPFVKKFREEREQVVMLLVDMSASKRFGTADSLKIETAAEIAAILAFNAIRNSDKVGVILFTDRVEKYIPPKKGTSHIWRVIKEIFTFEPEHTGTDIEAAVTYLGKVSRKRTVSFLISDFLGAGFSRRLTAVSARHEIISVLLSDPGDFRLPEGGLCSLQDLETGAFFTVDASDRRSRREYETLKLSEYQAIRDSLRRARIDCVELSTDGSVADALTGSFMRRERRKR